MNRSIKRSAARSLALCACCALFGCVSDPDQTDGLVTAPSDSTSTPPTADAPIASAPVGSATVGSVPVGGEPTPSTPNGATGTPVASSPVGSASAPVTSGTQAPTSPVASVQPSGSGSEPEPPSGGGAPSDVTPDPTGGGVVPGVDYELPVVAWPSEACVLQVNDLLAQMSLEQKAAQMVMGLYGDTAAGDVSSETLGTVFASGSNIIGAGSAADWASLIDGFIAESQSTPNGVPILFGIDAVHGNSKATDAVIFPHNIGLGATRNPELVERIGAITALEMLATGATWTFAPVFSVAHDDRWGRAYESYSEDPADVALFGTAQVIGLQGRGGLGTGTPGVIACAKHFAGDGQATFGTSRKVAVGNDPGGLVDRADVQLDEAGMRSLGIAPYIPAIAAGLGSIMVADTSWNGVNMTGHQQLLTTILKEELGFGGFVTTDWDAATPGQGGPGVVGAINAGVDMLMAANDWKAQKNEIVAAAGSTIPQARIDDAVRRVLTVKCEAGLFDFSRDTALLAQVGSEEHRAVGRQAVRESLVLLQHAAGVLPLTKGSNVWVAGTGADALDRQTGGWTISWQNGGDMTQGATIRQGVAAVANLVATPAEANAAIVVLSEGPYAEWRGDVSSIDTLAAEDFALLLEARSAGIPVIAIIVSGRPVLISDELANADAWIAAWLPGTEGNGIAEVLFGDYNFTGTLSHSWPQTNEQAALNKGDAGFEPLFAYGHGLTY